MGPTSAFFAVSQRAYRSSTGESAPPSAGGGLMWSHAAENPPGSAPAAAREKAASPCVRSFAGTFSAPAASTTRIFTRQWPLAASFT